MFLFLPSKSPRSGGIHSIGQACFLAVAPHIMDLRIRDRRPKYEHSGWSPKYEMTSAPASMAALVMSCLDGDFHLGYTPQPWIYAITDALNEEKTRTALSRLANTQSEAGRYPDCSLECHGQNATPVAETLLRYIN
jgi:hypothetical protein